MATLFSTQIRAWGDYTDAKAGDPVLTPALTVRIRERFLSFPSSARLQARRRERSPGEAFPAYPKFVACAGESAGHLASY